jgi:hypothetical protein
MTEKQMYNAKIASGIAGIQSQTTDLSRSVGIGLTKDLSKYVDDIALFYNPYTKLLTANNNLVSMSNKEITEVVDKLRDIKKEYPEQYDLIMQSNNAFGD